MTAEFADVAVGAAEGMDGWNTLSSAADGAELVEAAREAGAIETEALPEEKLGHLKGAAGQAGGRWRISAR